MSIFTSLFNCATYERAEEYLSILAIGRHQSLYAREKRILMISISWNHPKG
jgi:hypothetical protein